MKPDSVVGKKSFDFAIRIIGLYKEMSASREFVLSKQVLRSGTSIGANVQEALAGQSRRDFLHKMAIASKEARETRYWLQLIQASCLAKVNSTQLLKEVDELVRILTAIVKTTGQKLEKLKI